MVYYLTIFLHTNILSPFHLLPNPIGYKRKRWVINTQFDFGISRIKNANYFLYRSFPKETNVLHFSLLSRSSALFEAQTAPVTGFQKKKSSNSKNGGKRKNSGIPRTKNSKYRRKRNSFEVNLYTIGHLKLIFQLKIAAV